MQEARNKKKKKDTHYKVKLFDCKQLSIYNSKTKI